MLYYVTYSLPRSPQFEFRLENKKFLKTFSIPLKEPKRRHRLYYRSASQRDHTAKFYRKARRTMADRR